MLPSYRCSRARTDHTDDLDLQSSSDRWQGQGRRSVAGDHEQLDSMCRQEARILDRISFHSSQRLRPIRNPRGVAQIDEALVGQMLMQRAIDGQPADATVKDADGKRSTHPQITQITQITQISSKRTRRASGNYAPVSSPVNCLVPICVICVICGLFRRVFLPSAACLLLLWWRRRELNPDPKVNAEGLYMLSCFSFRVPGTHASGVLFVFQHSGRSAYPGRDLRPSRTK